MDNSAVPSTARSAAAVVLLTLVGVIAWAYLVVLANQMAPAHMGGMSQPAAMPSMPGMDMGPMPMAPSTPAPWTLHDFATMFVMWVVMMVAMMTPAVAPTALAYASAARSAGSAALAPVALLLAGYFLVWSAFSVVAVALQWALTEHGYLSPAMGLIATKAQGAVLIATGIYQWLPFTHTGLSRCCAPASFIASRGGYRSGIGAGLSTGLAHGIDCAVCCWALMLLLFAGGVMNLYWIAGLTVLVFLEQASGREGHSIARVSGVALAIIGALLLAQH